MSKVNTYHLKLLAQLPKIIFVANLLTTTWDLSKGSESHVALDGIPQQDVFRLPLLLWLTSSIHDKQKPSKAGQQHHAKTNGTPTLIVTLGLWGA